VPETTLCRDAGAKRPFFPNFLAFLTNKTNFFKPLKQNYLLAANSQGIVKVLEVY